METGAGGISLADRLEIYELIATYCWAMDSHDADRLLRTYAPDGVFSGAIGTFSGHAELRSQVERRAADHHATQHFVTNTVLERDGEDVLAESYCVILGSDEDGPRMRVRGYYHDRIVRFEGRWVFAQRTFQSEP